MNTYALSINQGDDAIDSFFYKYLAGAVRKQQYSRILIDY